MTPRTGARGGAPWTRMAAMCTAHQHVALPSVEPHRDGLGRKRVVARFSSATDGIGRAVDWVAQQRWTVAVAEARQWHGWSAKDAKQRRDRV
jgi:thiamine biosynthesis protein ThiC